jgi:hypothetical protein
MKAFWCRFQNDTEELLVQQGQESFELKETIPHMWLMKFHTIFQIMWQTTTTQSHTISSHQFPLRLHQEDLCIVFKGASLVSLFAYLTMLPKFNSQELSSQATTK